MQIFEFKDIETSYQELVGQMGDQAVTGALITFLGNPWDQDVMIWGHEIRQDMFRLAWQKRKIDLAKSLDGSIAAAYRPPVGTGTLETRFGMPTGVRIELVF